VYKPLEEPLDEQYGLEALLRVAGEFIALHDDVPEVLQDSQRALVLWTNIALKIPNEE